jgi:hypothetical protein
MQRAKHARQQKAAATAISQSPAVGAPDPLVAPGSESSLQSSPLSGGFKAAALSQQEWGGFSTPIKSVAAPLVKFSPEPPPLAPEQSLAAVEAGFRVGQRALAEGKVLQAAAAGMLFEQRSQ